MSRLALLDCEGCGLELPQEHMADVARGRRIRVLCPACVATWAALPAQTAAMIEAKKRRAAGKMLPYRKEMAAEATHGRSNGSGVRTSPAPTTA